MRPVIGAAMEIDGQHTPQQVIAGLRATGEGEDLIQRRFHGAGDDWLEKAAAALPMGKLGQADEIADFVVFLLSARSGVVTGSVIDWDQVVPGAYE